MLIESDNMTAFTLLEVIVAIAIVAILGAIVVPYAVGASETVRVTQTSNDLKAFRAANTAFASSASRQLGRVSFASINPTASDTTSCNGLQPVGGTAFVVYTAAQAGNWTGPYMNRANSRQGGFVTGIGVIRDIVRRTSANGTAGDLVLMIPKVRLEDAQALNDLMDGDGGTGVTRQNNSAGTVRYPNANSQLLVDSVTYQFAVSNQC